MLFTLTVWWGLIAAPSGEVLVNMAVASKGALSAGSCVGIASLLGGREGKDNHM